MAYNLPLILKKYVSGVDLVDLLIMMKVIIMKNTDFYNYFNHTTNMNSYN